MAVANLSAALPAPAHPMANPGFGKRNAPDQAPPTGDDFAHLPRREAAIAAFIDRLPEGAAMDAKTLAKVLPDYGQLACRTALGRLKDAGHVFYRQVAAVTERGVRWVTRTFFSRTARSGEWWKRFERGEVPAEGAPEPEPEPVPAAAPRASRAYRALASLGRTDPRLTLSAAECAHLEPLAAEWLSRHITTEQLVAAVTAGLPSQIHSPAGFVRKRLETKMPPLPPRPVPAYNDHSAPPSYVGTGMQACICCSNVDIATAMGDGECAKCAQVPPDIPETFLSEDPWGDGQDDWSALPPEEVTRRVDVLRAAAGIARKART
ncbi:hypothetical protein [Streptomyces sp. NPDC021096]|uniref:hypothetical protein n=1 Tax=Streptomyces sp. NPDC021096 TaxID=3154792 RepID=UPI0033FC4AD5